MWVDKTPYKWLDGVLWLLIGFVSIAPLLRSQVVLGADATFLLLLLLCLAGETELICRVRSMAGPCHSGDHYFLARPTTGSQPSDRTMDAIPNRELSQLPCKAVRTAIYPPAKRSLWTP